MKSQIIEIINNLLYKKSDFGDEGEHWVEEKDYLEISEKAAEEIHKIYDNQCTWDFKGKRKMGEVRNYAWIMFEWGDNYEYCMMGMWLNGGDG